MEEHDALLTEKSTPKEERASLLISDDTSVPKEKDKYVLSPYRWVLCFFFIIQQIGVGIGMVGYTTITPSVRDYYGVTNIATSLLVLSFTIAFIPLNFPANQLIESKGISWPIRIHCVCVFAGSFTRLFLKESFYFILAGQ
jgi:hypothetical protein